MIKTKIFFATIGLLVAMTVVGVAGWQFDWWLKEKEVNRQVQIDNRNKGTQVAWRDEARSAASDYELVDPSNTAARGALRNKACSLIVRLAPSYKDDDLAQFESKECK
jgi:hypothetical protein